MSDIVFELCAEALDACIAARDGGAHRIELCSALSEGGLTPSHALVRAAVECSGLPVHVMIRPRGGGFVYGDAEFALIEADLDHARSLGASGFVVGILTAEGNIDLQRMRRLVDLAGDLEVTFHRAFDTLADLDDALERVIDSGCRRILTSGGAVDVETGASRLRALHTRAAGRIVIAAGGGLRTSNAAYVAATSALESFHGSVRCVPSDPNRAEQTHEIAFRPPPTVRPEDVRAILAELSRGSSLKC